MAVPKKKMSRSRTRRRKAGWKVPGRAASVCPQCGAGKLPHRVCENCGTYKGREMVVVEE